MRTFVALAMLYLAWGTSPVVGQPPGMPQPGTVMPPGFTPPPGSIILTAEQVASMQAGSDDLAKPSQVRTQAITALAISYDVAYQSDGKALSQHKVYESSKATLVEKEGEYVFACAEHVGGFLLGKLPGATGYSVQKLLPADRLSLDPAARYEFEQLCGMAARGLRPNGGFGTQIANAESLFIGPFVQIISRENGQNGLLKVRYKQSAPPNVPNALAVTGFAVLDTSAFNVLLELEQQTSGAGITGLHRETRTYYSPSAEIPYPLLKEIVISQKSSGKSGGSNQTKMLFSNYKIEAVPIEKLRLSYYKIPDKLIASESRDFWLYYLAAGVVISVIAGLWLARRHKRKTTT